MSLRQRVARFRRYGLAPLPADATPEQREDRIAELRRLRRRRVRKTAAYSGVGTLLLVVLLAGALYWLLTTIAGRQFLMAQIVARLPANTTLTWEKAEGPAAGPLRLHGVRFTWFACADPDRPVNAPLGRCKDRRTSTFTAQQVLLDTALRPLLGRTLRLNALEVQGATLDLADDGKPFELPQWPEVLPRIEPPLAIHADTIRIDGLTVTQAGKPAIAIHTVRGGLHAEQGHLHVERLEVDSDRGRFALHGNYTPRDNYAMHLQGTAVFPAPLGQTAGRVGLIARGDLTRLDVSVGGRAPAPLRAVLTLRAPGDSEEEQDRARWRLQATTTALDPAVFTGERGGTPMAFAVQAEGVGGRANLRGTWQQGEQRVVIQPSKVMLEDKTLLTQPLVVDALGGRITLNGRGDFKEPENTRFRFAANARGLRWGGTTAAAPLVAGDGDFGVAGTRDAWAVVGKATLQREGQRANVQLDGRGDATGLTVQSLRAVMPTGQLQATGRVDWQPRTRWSANAVLSGFDPGYFVTDWPGAVNGRIASKGEIAATGQLQSDIVVTDLGGRLRQRPLGGRGNVQLRGEDISGDVAVTLGSSRVVAKGSIGQRLDVDATLSPLQLNDFLPSASGQVEGTLQLRGPRTAFDIDADLRGGGVRVGDYRAERFTARGRLPWKGDNGRLQIDASGIQAGMAFDTLQATATGAMENLSLQAKASGAMGAGELAGTARRIGTQWRGTLAQLQLAPTKGATWRLQAPLDVAQAGDTWTLSRGCMAASDGGSLCAVGQWPGRGLDVSGRGLPLVLVTPYLPERPSANEAWQLNGLVDLDAKVRPVGNAWAGTAQLRSASGGMKLDRRARHDLINYANLTLDVVFDPQRLRAKLSSELRNPGSAAGGRLLADISTGWDAYAPLAGRIDIDSRELTWLELFSPDIVDPTGELVGNITLGGTRGNPQLGGNAALTNLRAELPALGIVFTQGNVQLTAQPDGNARLRGSVRSGDGVLALDGTLGWRGQDTPLVLGVSGKNVLIADTRDLRAVVDPDIRLQMQPGQPTRVTGSVRVPSARMDLERLDDGVGRSSDVVVLDPVLSERVVGGPASGPSSIDMDLNVIVGDDVQLRGFGLDGALGGSLRMRARPGREMTAIGTLTVDGRYRAYGQRLTIENGRLIWSNDPVGNPTLEVRAQREIGDVTAGIHVTGRASAPQARVWSNPEMDQSEALAYIALGRPLSRATDAEGRQLDAAAAALSAGGSLLASQLGARIGLDDAGVMSSRALGGTVVGVGKYLSPKLYVGYGVSLLGTGHVLMLKYLLRKGFNISIESSTVENRASVNWRTER